MEAVSQGSDVTRKLSAELEKAKADLATAVSDRDLLTTRIRWVWHDILDVHIYYDYFIFVSFIQFSLSEKDLRIDALSDKITAHQSEEKKTTARIEELTKEHAESMAKAAAAQADAQKNDAKASEVLTKLQTLSEEKEKALKERDAAQAELKQLNQQVLQFTTSREEYIAELKKGRDMLEETLQKRGALLSTLEQRLKEATEAAAVQVHIGICFFFFMFLFLFEILIYIFFPFLLPLIEWTGEATHCRLGDSGGGSSAAS